MKINEEHLGKMEKQLKEWGAKLDGLLAKAEHADEEAEAGYHKRVEALKTRYQAAEKEFVEARAAGSEKWETFKVSAEGAWHEFEVALKELTH